ncbi:MAG: hypothetical protein R3C12_25055 [Planctomycetaceae bacterium]|nr:hypothetical protein [Planctomycetaceae bacterium]
MNPQSFRNKLEQAVINRDQALLESLRQSASESPETSRLWQEHLLVEQAIQQWCIRPLASPQAATASRVAKRRSLNTMTGGGVMVACLMLLALGLGWLGFRSSPGNSLASNDSAAIPVAERPARAETADFPPSGSDHAATASLARQESEGATLPFPNAFALADQGRLLNPVALLPQMPNVSEHLEQGMSATWETLSTLPMDMWQKWQVQPKAEGNDQLAPEPVELEESRDSQRKRTRRPRPPRIFSLDLNEAGTSLA